MGRSHAAARDAGSKLERETAEYLTETLGMPVVRRVRTGKDRGDIHGVQYAGQGIVIECKDVARLALAQWVGEAASERANDGALAGIVVHKRKGKGHPRDQYVTMTLGELAAILRGNRDHLKLI
jgi:hypothetical protein